MSECVASLFVVSVTIFSSFCARHRRAAFSFLSLSIATDLLPPCALNVRVSSKPATKMLLNPALTVCYHLVVAAFGHVWMLFYTRRLPLPLLLLSATTNLCLMVGEHVEPILSVPGGQWIQEHSFVLHVLSIVPATFFCFLVCQRVDIVRGAIGFLVLLSSDFVALTVIVQPPNAYDCVALARSFEEPGGWVVYLWSVDVAYYFFSSFSESCLIPSYVLFLCSDSQSLSNLYPE